MLPHEWNVATYTCSTLSMKGTWTWWCSNEEFWHKALRRRAFRSDAATFEQKKWIFFMPIPTIWFKVKKNRLEYRPYLYSANIYLFKVSKGNTRKRCEICLKLTTKTLQQRRSVVFLVNFKHISHLFLVLLLLTLSK